MKKFISFLIILLSLFVITGCNSEKEVTRFSTDKETNKPTTTVVEVNKKPEAKPTVETTKETATKTTVKFAITSLKENLLKSDKGYHLIQGSTPEDTDQIVVNGYALSKYKSSETHWSYIAATSLGTLKKGENSYEVKALDKNGGEIASKTFTIVYDGVNGGILAATGGSLNLSLLLTALLAFGFYAFRSKFMPSKR